MKGSRTYILGSPWPESTPNIGRLSNAREFWRLYDGLLPERLDDLWTIEIAVVSYHIDSNSATWIVGGILGVGCEYEWGVCGN